jgi:hypothetical protein
MRGEKEERSTPFFFLSMVLLLGLIDSVGHCLFKLLGPEVVGKPWPAVPVASSSLDHPRILPWLGIL